MSFAPEVTTRTAAVVGAPAHQGFTFIVDGGFGLQHDSVFGNAMGFSGLNVGAGWFVTDRMAVMFRWTGTYVNFDDFGTHQASGVIGGVIQYWASDRVAIEAGAGSGRWRDNQDTSDGSDDDKDTGFGLILGAFFPVWQSGSNHVMVGAEYTPVFTDGVTVHNVGINVAYQWGKKK
ncbi:MAG TPA: outer membrane beta-barrel protein [Vicinamibacterales bacterium]|nr:outer membrane beta-barrel protein [Vicinamibacterales bacterium]